MDDWDADPAPAAANKDDEAWGVAAAALPLPDDDDNFGASSPLKKTNTVVTITEIAPTPAASGDDEDWDMGGTSAPAPVPAASGDDDWDWDAAKPAAPVAVADGNEFSGGGGFGALAPVAAQDDAFGGGGGFDAPDPVAAQDDAFGSGGGDGGAFSAAAAAQDGFSAVAEPPAVVKKKRVLDKNLRPPEKSKAFADFFVPQHSEQYEDPEPDPREMPLRRNETHNLYSKELAMSVAAGADKPQEDTENKTKKKSAITYNGNRITSNHVWTDYQFRLLLGLINRNIHTAGKPEGIDKANKRTVMERRKFLNDHLPKATDGHTHIGQWAYHDVAELLNNDIDRSNIPVVDVRDMIHRLVDERKGGQLVAHRFKAPHLTHRIVVAWKRKQDFVGDLKEWLGDKEREGRKFILARQKEENQQASEEVVYNPGRVVPASGANADVFAVRSGWAHGAADGNAFSGDVEAVPEVVAPVEGGDFGGFGGPAPAAAPGVVAEWDDDGDDGSIVPATVLPSIETGEWDAENVALATGLAAFNNATPAPAKAPTPEPVKVAEPLRDFGLADPFSAPLPGNTGFQNSTPDAPAAVAVAEWDEDDSPAAPAAVAEADKWNEDESAPAAGQSANTDTVMADAPGITTNDGEPATGGGAGDEWGKDDDAAPAASSVLTTSGSTIPRSTTTGSIDTMMDNTNTTSQTTTGYKYSGFTAVNAPAPPQPGPTSAPAPAYTIDPTTRFNPERLALLAAKGDREDTPPEREKRDPWAGAGESASVKPKNGGVSGFNAMPLAFNRLTGERADPAVVAASAAAAQAKATGARMPLDVTQSNGTPLPTGWGDSPNDVEMGGGGDWGAESPGPAAAKPTDEEGENGDAADGGEDAQENKPKEKKYVDLDAGWDAAGADDVELDY